MVRCVAAEARVVGRLLPLGLVPAGVLEERAEDLATGLYPGTSAATNERPRTAVDGSPAPQPKAKKKQNR